MGRRSHESFSARLLKLGVAFFLSLVVSGIGLPEASAFSYTLTGNGLGQSAGNKGKTLTVSPELKITSLTNGNETGYPTGKEGTIYLHQTDGTGVQTTSTYNRGYQRINGYYTGAYESLVFNFYPAVSGEAIKLYFNRIHHHYESYGYVWLDIWIKPSSGSSFNIPNVMNYYHKSGGDHDPNHTYNPDHETNGTEYGYFDFSEIPDLDGVGSITRIIVRAGRNSHFFINKLECVTHVDNDHDGYPSDVDCNDNNANINPGAAEICNGIDDNCNGHVDEGCTTYYYDNDHDGFGKTSQSVTATSPPPGYVATAGDCNDQNAMIYPGASEACNGTDDDCDTLIDEDCTLQYRDADGDGFGDSSDSTTVPQAGYVPNAGDCDDTDANVNPDEVETCNGTDDNCDGNVDEGCVQYFRDADGDTYGDPGNTVFATSPPSGFVTNSSDCDDTEETINPGAAETCNGEDDNCNGGIDEGCTTYYRDADGDGYGDPTVTVVAIDVPSGYVANDDDCDDSQVASHPGAAEGCDGIDNDCDGNTDEGCAVYYRDADGDNFGNPAVSITATSQPAGYVANAGDCNDGNAAIKPGATEICNSVDENCNGIIDDGCATYYRDADGDNYGNPAISITATSKPTGYVANAGDCNDGNAAIHPGAVEQCNGINDNCDGMTDEGCVTYYRDADGDNYGNPTISLTATSPPAGYVANTGDCNDSAAAVNPGAAEVCNGVDDDCDGTTDVGCPLQYRDADGDGYGNPAGPTSTYPRSGYVANDGDCNDGSAAIRPNATETCNSIDDNCDGDIDEGCATYYRDADNDTYGNPGNSTTATSKPAGYVANGGDCNDGNAAVNPGATETCNSIDDNCDGNTDEGCATYYRDADNDTYGNPAVSVTATSKPAGYVSNAGDCNDGNAAVNPGRTETCNGIDDNCNGSTDEGCATYYRDSDGDTYGDPGVAVTATSKPAGYVTNSGDCNDSDNTIYQGAPELCDGKNNDCDTQTDEGCALQYRDADSDGYGNPAGPTTTVPQSGYVANAGDCNDGNAAVNPGETEACNSIDDNCNGSTDEGCTTYYRDADGDDFGNAAVSQVATSQPSGYVTSSTDCNDGDNTIYPGASELCDGKDNDCDTQTDEGCTLLYRDVDGDGYGNPAGPTTTIPQSGYVANAGDCNDSNAAVNPGATETCNSIDDNCDGDIDEGCATYYRDVDGDTYGDPGVAVTATGKPAGYVTNSGDCNDSDDTVYQGAPELCDGKNNDCDSQTDEGCATLYRDADNDSYGNPAGPTTTVPQSGYVANSGDCNDSSAAVHPGATETCNSIDDNCNGSTDEGCTTYYRDADNDGFGNPAITQVATSKPSGFVANGSDCNDADNTIYPGASELCDGKDNDCDTQTDEGCATLYRDADSDGFGNPAGPTTSVPQAGYVANAGDCNDGNAAINPGETEICNSIDDNCDGNTDEGCVTYYRDSDSDGYGNSAISTTATSPPAGYVANASDCNDAVASIHPGATEACNGVDDNCDDTVDEGCPLLYRDADGDTYGNPAGPTSTYPQSGYVANTTDCNDGNAAIHPGAAETCNTVDDDCDGTVDEGCATYYRDADGDTYGNPAISTTATSQPTGYVANAGDCNDNQAGIKPSAIETCNGVDDNCDGHTDEGCITYYRDADGDTYGNPGNTKTAVSKPAGYVDNASDCNDNSAAVHPGVTETCNNIDDNCDGTVDEGCITYYRDADGDGYGTNADTKVGGTTPPPGYVAADGDCNDANDHVYPGATEQCNHADDDCDGSVDESCVTYYQDADGDGYGNPIVSQTVASPAPPPGYVANNSDCDDTNALVYPGATDVIDGVDNDCDGQIDEGTCVTDCSVCDLNDDGVCDDLDLVIFGDSHGWNEFDCNEPNVECLCDLVVNAGGTCDDLDGTCFTQAYEREDCRASLYVQKLRTRTIEPGQAFNIIGTGFGNGAAGSVVHIKGKEYEYGNTRIKLWSDTKIRVKLPQPQYTKNNCAWFNGQASRSVQVWVTVGGQNSNAKRLTITNPCQ